jgi:hypothetical protein
MRIIGSSWIMDHSLTKLCLLPCFTLVASFCALVPCCHHPRKRGTTGGPSQGNFLFPAILNTFHLGACHGVLNFGNGSWFILSLDEGVEGPEVDAVAIYIYIYDKGHL